jgi:hypothetical protein
MKWISNLMRFVVAFNTVLHNKGVCLLPVLLPQVCNSHFDMRLEILVPDIGIQLWFCLLPVPDFDRLVQQLQEFSLGMDNPIANLVSYG